MPCRLAIVHPAGSAPAHFIQHHRGFALAGVGDNLAQWRLERAADDRHAQPLRVAASQSGKRVRGRFTLDSVEEKAPGQVLMRHLVTVEIEGEDKPALAATWLGLIFV